MINSKISAVAAALVMVSGSAIAETQVVGQVSASPSAIVVADTVETRIGKAAVPYIQGDVVTTSQGATSNVRLSSGKANFEAAPNSSFVIVNGEAGEIALNSGAVEVSAAAEFPIVVTSSAGTFEVSAEGKLDALLLVEGERFAVVSKSNDVFVRSQGGVVSKVSAGEAFSYNGEAEVVEVAVLAPFFATLGVAGTIAAIAAGVIVIDEIADDDDDGSPN